MPATQQSVAQTTIDEAYLGAFYGCDENDLHNLIATPTTDLVASFLQRATLKAREYESLRAQKLQADVELENIVRTSDTKQRAQKATLTRQAKEIEELRTKVNEAEGSRETYVTQLSNLQSNALDSTNETQTLRSRITSLEQSNRDTLALIESHSAEKDRVHKELEQTHSKVIDLRKDVSKLEDKNRTLESQVSSQKFKEQSLKQQLDLLKNNNDRQAEDIRTTTAEQAKARKERNARINLLERERDDAVASLGTLRQTETSLRQRLDELQQRVETELTQNAVLKEDKLRQEQSYQSQITSTKRLADLHAQNAATHKARLEELQDQIDSIRDNAAEEIARLQVEVETERADKAQADRTVAELELRLEEQQRPHTPVPGTPTANGNLALATIPGSAQKAVRNLTNTQLYTNYVESKQALEIEQRRTAKLQTTLDELLHEMESRAPELLELRQEQDRLEGEIVEFSRMLDDANETRDTAIREAQKWQEQFSVSVKEGEVLRQQLRDVSAQIKILLVELRSKDQGLEDMTVEERLELERAARGAPPTIENDTQQWISERLVIFRSVDELQGRNEELLQVVRQLGDKMEGEEAQQKARQSAAYASENDELRKQVERYKDEMQATAVQIDSYMKERDMFRRMLQHRGTIAQDADMQALFGNSIMPATPQRNAIEPATPRSKDVEDLNKLLKEHQKFFDQFRNESAVDRRTLKNQADLLTQEKNNLQHQVASISSQLGLANNRYELLQSNYNNLSNENVELQKRTQSHFETAAKQDLRTQQVAEDLIEAQSQIATLQNEKSNSKAEKELWKRLEDRLTEDNKNLMDERSRLSKLNVDLSNLMNERERDANEARRRLQSQAEKLETELADIKRKLDNEVESGKKAVLRREYEESQNRTRIDDLTKSLGYAREELAAAKTAKDQSQSRVDELKIELRAAEEKAAALQPRPSTRTNGTTTDANELAPEQRLAVELSDAKRDLEFARSELESAREQIEQYKTIAQTTEEELASFNQTSEQYREESDALLAEKDATIKQLEQRVEDLTSELTATNAELSDLRTQHDNASQDLASQRASLESELAQLKDDAERHDEEKRMYQEDLKAQADIAQHAQQSYESELVKHADAARELQTARQRFNDLRSEISDLQAAAAEAQTKLETGQESWSEQKGSLQREVTELGRRRDDMAAQNDALHKQLETFSTELQALRQGRAIPQTEGEDDGADSNLQEVITYLRREKEIIEVQHQLAVQEGQRVQQQLDYANGRIEELDVKLTDERRQHAEQATRDASTSKLAQTIDELNLFRESAVTLRNEARQARERFDDKSKEVDRLHAELQPLQARLAELEADIEVKDGEINLITTDRDHWRDRTQNIISKYDRVDPAELEELKARTQTLQAEKEALEAEQIPLKEQIEAAEQRITEAETAATQRIERFKEQAKQRSRDQNTKINELRTDLTTAQAERTQLQTELDAAKEELVQAATKSSTTAEPTGLSEDEAEALRSRIAEADAQASVRTIEVEALQAQVHELEQQIETLTSELTAAQAATSTQEQGEIVEDDGAEEALAQAQQDLANAKQEISRLQAEFSEGRVPTTQAAEEGEQSDIATEVAKLREEMEQQHELAIKQIQDAADAKIAKMKSNLARQLQEQRAQIQEDARATLIQEHSVELEKVRSEHEQEIKTLKEVHAAELYRLKQDVEESDGRVPSNTTIGSSVGEAATNTAEITDEYVNDLMKNNQRVRTVMQNSVRKTVGKETEKLSQALAAKDAEIAKLKETSTASNDNESNTQANDAALKEILEQAKLEKEAAVRQALDNAEKKAAVQLSQRNIAQAKVAFVAKAAADTPTRAVAEVWEEAKKAKPPPKPEVKPAASNIPSTGPAADAEDTSSEAAKLKARKERFGNPPGTQVLAQPSTSVEPGQTAPNPEAAPFVPATEGESTARASGIPAPTRGRGGGARGASGISFQGAAARGGQASGIARGGFGGGNRGGLKRQYEGGPGGDGKRARGGGPNA